MFSALSIDQNSNSLWDTLPKLQALASKGVPTTHLIEDIDTAFTRVDQTDSSLKLTTERYYPNGSLDWGASLFYMDFLGRCPFDLHELEKYTGKTVSATAKALQLSVDKLFEIYSVGDNQQLTAPSFIDTNKNKHRLLGDISREEVLPFIDQLFDIAEKNLLERFIDESAKERIRSWFQQERRLTKRGDNLSEIYHSWLNHYLPIENLSYTSHYFSEPEVAELNWSILDKICKNYQHFKNLYNEAITETNSELNLMKDGDLPFFAIYESSGHLVRSALTWRDNSVWLNDQILQREQIICLTGKALLLVILARLEQGGNALALPENGSLYVPTAICLAKKMQQYGFISGDLKPIYRVKMNLLDGFAESEMMLQLPDYLHWYFGAKMSAKEFANSYQAAIAESEILLGSLQNEKLRQELFTSWTVDLSNQISDLELLKRECGQDPERRHRCSQIWTDIKILQQKKEQLCYGRIVDIYQTRGLDYWNSRGAILPISIALGGDEFYQTILENSEIYEDC